MRRHIDDIVPALLLVAIAVLAIGGLVGIAVVARPMMISSLAGPELASTYRPGKNPWRSARSNAGGEGLPQRSVSYVPGTTPIPEGAALDFRDRSFTIVAEITIPRDGAEGTIVAEGGRSGGWAFYVTDSRPVFHYNLIGIERYTIAAGRALPPGSHMLVLAFAYDGGGAGKGGSATISVDGETVAGGRIDKTIPAPISFGEGLDIGEDTGSPVNLTYDPPFRFSGGIAKVDVTVD